MGVVPMGEEGAAAEENVGAARGEVLDTVNERLVEPLTAELLDELVVVNLASFFGRNFPWIHNLFFFFFFLFFLFIL